MIISDAVFLDGKTSCVKRVTVEISDETLCVFDMESEAIRKESLGKCKLESAPGKTRNAIIFPDGSRCETYDSKAFKKIKTGRNSFSDTISSLESLWIPVFAGIFAAAALVYAAAVHGIPFLADMIAPEIPAAVIGTLSERTLESLDNGFLEKTGLSLEKQRVLEELFKLHARNIIQNPDCRLVFRKSDRLGANAFALPSGKIIITDELAGLYTEDLEMAGIFAHEIAHVKYRHGIKNIIQNTGIFILVSLVIGDFTVINSSAAMLPVILAESGYSRKSEKEADIFAGEYLVKISGSTRPYRQILEKLSGNGKNPEIPKYLSTHPPLEERISLLKSAEK